MVRSNVNKQVTPVICVGVCVCVFRKSGLVTLVWCTTLALPHSFNLNVSLPVSPSPEQCNIWSIQSSPARMKLNLYPLLLTLCVSAGVWLYEAGHHRSRYGVGVGGEYTQETTHLNPPSTSVCRSLPLSFFLSLIDLAFERRAKRGTGAKRERVSKPESERGRHR